MNEQTGILLRGSLDVHDRRRDEGAAARGDVGDPRRTCRTRSTAGPEGAGAGRALRAAARRTGRHWNGCPAAAGYALLSQVPDHATSQPAHLRGGWDRDHRLRCRRGAARGGRGAGRQGGRRRDRDQRDPQRDGLPLLWTGEARRRDADAVCFRPADDAEPRWRRGGRRRPGRGGARARARAARSGDLPAQARDIDEDDDPLDAVLELLPDVPAGKLAIAEVDVSSREEVLALERAGVDAVLVALGPRRRPGRRPPAGRLDGERATMAP